MLSSSGHGINWMMLLCSHRWRRLNRRTSTFSFIRRVWKVSNDWVVCFKFCYADCMNDSTLSKYQKEQFYVSRIVSLYIFSHYSYDYYVWHHLFKTDKLVDAFTLMMVSCPYSTRLIFCLLHFGNVLASASQIRYHTSTHSCNMHVE